MEGSVAGYQELGSRSNCRYRLCNESPPQVEFIDCRTHKRSIDWVVKIPLGYSAIAIMSVVMGLLGGGWMTLKILSEDSLFYQTCKVVTWVVRLSST